MWSSFEHSKVETLQAFNFYQARVFIIKLQYFKYVFVHCVCLPIFSFRKREFFIEHFRNQMKHPLSYVTQLIVAWANQLDPLFYFTVNVSTVILKSISNKIHFGSQVVVALPGWKNLFMLRALRASNWEVWIKALKKLELRLIDRWHFVSSSNFPCASIIWYTDATHEPVPVSSTS